jgi:hypothetical protein
MTLHPLPIHAATRKSPRVNILVWHDIIGTERDRLVWFDTTAKQFRQQCTQLKQAGAQVIPLRAAIQWMSTGKNPPPPGATVLCFDDNTSGISTFGIPILREFGWSCVLSAHTDYAGVRTSKPHHSWKELTDLVATGNVELVNQTASHPPDLRKLTKTKRLQDFDRARKAYAKHIATPPVGITYPSGKYDARVIDDALGAGFTYGLTEDHGVAELSRDMMRLHRWSTHARWDEALAAVKRSARS